MKSTRPALFALFMLSAAILFTLCATSSRARHALSSGASPLFQKSAESMDARIAARYAPVFYQALGEKRRSDYITKFDFDGDWRGDDNWTNAENERFPLRGYIYYAVSETPTHLFIHYAVFHPQDYKGGEKGGTLLSEILREGVKRGGKYDPTGLSDEAVLAHENDMEGCLVVVLKSSEETETGGTVIYVETLAHNRFLKYAAGGGERKSAQGFEAVRVVQEHPLLYIEPKGHGIQAYTGREKQSPRGGLLVYSFTGKAEEPLNGGSDAVTGYDLLPLLETLWPPARKGVNQTYGAVQRYVPFSFEVSLGAGRTGKRSADLGTLGTAFLGVVGAPNMARPPWAWADRNEQDQPLGQWFFDPAATIKHHFNTGADFSLAYTHAPFLGLFRTSKKSRDKVKS